MLGYNESVQSYFLPRNPVRNYKEFERSMGMSNGVLPGNEDAWSSSGYSNNTTSSIYKYTREQIKNAINNATDPTTLSEISQYFFTASGIYQQLIIHLSEMPTYDTVIMPKNLTQNSTDAQKSKVGKNMEKATRFLDAMNIPCEFSRITKKVLIDGAYYGVVVDNPNIGYFTFVDLDPTYCRSRFKDYYGNPLLEINVTWFDTFDESDKNDALNSMPKAIRDYYNKYRRNSMRKIGKKNLSMWCVCPAEYGVAFFYNDSKSPMFLSAIPDIVNLDEYMSLEKEMDAQNLERIITFHAPRDKNDQLIYELPEVTVYHRAVSAALKKRAPHVTPITTPLDDVEVHDLTSRREASKDNIDKVTNPIYNQAGISKVLFNSDNASAINLSITNDFAKIYGLCKIYAKWMTYKINTTFAKKNTSEFEVTILPVSHYNRDDMFSLYLQSAQYGYGKILAGVTSGIKQSSMVSMITYENEILDLPNIMIPVRSSHTETNNDAEASSAAGAPEKALEDKSQKTIDNIEAQ